jgi:hypothetical protein
MIYILINNDYQFYDLNNWINDFKDDEITLIQIPHKLNPLNNNTDHRFSNVFCFKSYFNNLFFLFNFFKINKIHNEIIKRISPQKSDILFIYTEYEILNQFIINIFYKAKAKIYLIEDGLATMTMFNIVNPKADIRSIMKAALIKSIFWNKYKYLRIINCPDQTPIMSDFIFNGVFVKFGKSIKRNIKLINYKPNSTTSLNEKNFNQNAAIFLNNDLYTFFCTYNEYIKYLHNSISAINEKFDVVYFKFHPRETNFYKEKISLEISRYKNIVVIQSEEIIEKTIQDYMPKFAFSHLSASLINLYFLGIEPIFLLNMEKDLIKNKFVAEINNYLINIKYNFLNNYNEITNTYKSGLYVDNKSTSIYNYIKSENFK